MPIMLNTSISVRPRNALGQWWFTLANSWQWLIPWSGGQYWDVPEDATAFIIRITPPVTGYTQSVSICEAYSGEADTNWGGSMPVDEGEVRDIIVAWRGIFSAVIRFDLSNSSYVGDASIIGYFTKGEFTPYTTRQQFQVLPSGISGGTDENFDISGQSWFRAEATAYLASHDVNARIRTKGWRNRSNFTDVEPTVFWPDGNNQCDVYANTENQKLNIAGYFTGRVIKGTGYPGGIKALAAEHKPIGDPEEGTKLLHSVPANYALIISRAENYANLGRQLQPYTHSLITTITSASDWGWYAYPAGSTGDSQAGREGREMFIYASADNANKGETYLYPAVYQQYNYDSYIQYCAFPHLERPTSPIPPEVLQLDEWVLNNPSLVSTIANTLAFPVAYRTVSGEYSWSGTLSLKLSGGASNADPTLSLGGVVSTTPMGTDILGPVTNRKAQLGGPEYRCVYVQNSSATETAYGLILWIENQARLGNRIQLGIDPAGIGGTAGTIASEEIDPAGVTFFTPSGEANAMFLGVLGPLQTIPIWIRRDVDIQNPYKGNETVSLAFSISNNG